MQIKLLLRGVIGGQYGKVNRDECARVDGVEKAS